MTLEAGKEMDRRCVMNWLNEVYITPSRVFDKYTEDELKMFAYDALALLKEQEPMIPVFLPIGNRYIVTKQCNYRCANCGELICRNDLFCEHCGKPVKWDDR